MMSPATQLLASRISGETGQAGYSIRKLTSKMTDAGYEMKINRIGRVCIPGGKANFSFDERYLVTHHYLTRADFESDEAFAPYKEKGAADIYVVESPHGRGRDPRHAHGARSARALPLPFRRLALLPRPRQKSDKDLRRLQRHPEALRRCP
ncbi:MAG: hypothetical protein QM760_02380 [Nibricoccus sp.]